MTKITKNKLGKRQLTKDEHMSSSEEDSDQGTDTEEEREEREQEKADDEAEELITLGRNLDDALPYDIFNRLIGGYLIGWERGPKDKP